jgi:hypothetical protein
MNNAQPISTILAFLGVTILICIASGLVDWVERVLARPRLRPFMVWRMYRLARQNYGICTAYYMARVFEKATRYQEGK